MSKYSALTGLQVIKSVAGRKTNGSDPAILKIRKLLDADEKARPARAEHYRMWPERGSPRGSLAVVESADNVKHDLRQERRDKRQAIVADYRAQRAADRKAVFAWCDQHKDGPPFTWPLLKIADVTGELSSVALPSARIFASAWLRGHDWHKVPIGDVFLWSRAPGRFASFPVRERRAAYEAGKVPASRRKVPARAGTCTRKSVNINSHGEARQTSNREASGYRRSRPARLAETNRAHGRQEHSRPNADRKRTRRAQGQRWRWRHAH